MPRRTKSKLKPSSARVSIKVAVGKEDKKNKAGKIGAVKKTVKPKVKKIVVKKTVAKKRIVAKKIVRKISSKKKIRVKPKLKKEFPVAVSGDVGKAVQDKGKDNKQTEIDNAESFFVQALNKKKSESNDALLEKGDIVKNAVASSLEGEQNKAKEDEINEVKPQRSISLYRKIAFSFILLTIILLAIVAYFSFVKVTITLIPNQERISNNMIIDIYDKEKDSNFGDSSISGAVKLIKIEQEGIYPASGEEIIGQEAVGKVKIINNYIKNQPLVASTRFLTSNDKIFRIKRTVNVPAGGSVEAKIYADEPDSSMVIGPTKFTIPGLWAGLQNKIYAESSEPIVYKQKVKKHIIQSDIDNSIRDLKQRLLAKVKSEIDTAYQDYSQIIYKIDENSINSKVIGRAGEEKDEFTVSMRAEAIAVAFNDKRIVNLAKQKFMSSLPENKELIYFDEKNIIYSFDSYNSSEATATINSVFEGRTSLKENFNVVEIDKILGLNQQQLDAYLNSLPEIAGFEVRFYPSFIKKVPKLVDRVEIEIRK